MAEGGHDLIVTMIQQMREDMAAERETSRESRSRTHERIDEMVDRLSRIDTTIALAGEVDAQVRNELDELKKAMSGVTPTVDEWRTVKTIGKWGAGALITGGAGLGVFLAAAGDSAVAAIRHWLRIS
jgi:chromosome segregation ATPase